MRILLAEDEKALSRALVIIFEKNNYSADAVYNGEDALDCGANDYLPKPFDTRELLASASMLLLMAVLVLIRNIVNYTAVVSESDTVLDVLSQQTLPFPDSREMPDRPGERPFVMPRKR